jgi:hypothetical protein
VTDQQREHGQSYGGLIQKVIDIERRLAEDENEAKDDLKARLILERRVAQLEKQAAGWAGGFWTLAAVGTIVTFMIAFWDKITFGLRHP